MSVFTEKAPWIMQGLMNDFGLDVDRAAAIVGNFGHESGGFEAFQEKNPVVAGSKGGWGWGQWTGPRRRGFEAYAKRNNLDPKSDKANYSWAFIELKGLDPAFNESRAIQRLKAAEGFRNQVITFENAYERAGVKHYDSRVLWANRAKEAYLLAKAKGFDLRLPWVAVVPTEPKEDPREKALWQLLVELFNAIIALYRKD